MEISSADAAETANIAPTAKQIVLLALILIPFRLAVNVNIAPFHFGKEVAVAHWMRLGAKCVEDKKPNVLNEHTADAHPLQPARLCPASQHRTNGEQQSEQLGADPVVRLPSLKVVAVEVGRQPSHHGQGKGGRENNPALSLKEGRHVE